MFAISSVTLVGSATPCRTGGRAAVTATFAPHYLVLFSTEGPVYGSSMWTWVKGGVIRGAQPDLGVRGSAEPTEKNYTENNASSNEKQY